MYQYVSTQLTKLYQMAASITFCTYQRQMNFINQAWHRARCTVIIAAFVMLLGASGEGYAAQSSVEPRREQVLNGLNVLMLYRPGEASVMLKLRIHSGAAFDLTGKEGMMNLLADALFPDQATREYVKEELGGRLEVVTDYDAINVTLSGRASEFERLLELLRNGVTGASVGNEAYEKLREARLKAAKEEEVTPAMVADRVGAARLFGTYPYGRSISGVPQSLKRINRADLLLARERFLNPNNATLAIIGGVDHRRSLRALRQLLGIWRRSEVIVPATFRQPEAPDSRTLIVNLPNVETTELRLAVRGLRRSDSDSVATTVLAFAARDRWQKALDPSNYLALSVRHKAHALSGIFQMRASVPNTSSAAQTLEAAKKVLQDFAATPLSTDELERAKREAMTAYTVDANQPGALASEWLDAETYKVPPPEVTRTITNITPADLHRVAVKFFRDASVVSVAVGNETQLRTDLARTGALEVMSAGASIEIKVPTVPARRP